MTNTIYFRNSLRGTDKTTATGDQNSRDTINRSVFEASVFEQTKLLIQMTIIQAIKDQHQKKCALKLTKILQGITILEIQIGKYILSFV